MNLSSFWMLYFSLLSDILHVSQSSVLKYIICQSFNYKNKTDNHKSRNSLSQILVSYKYFLHDHLYLHKRNFNQYFFAQSKSNILNVSHFHHQCFFPSIQQNCKVSIFSFFGTNSPRNAVKKNKIFKLRLNFII